MRGNRDESSYVSSQLLQQFTKDTYQSQYAYPLHAYHSSSKIQSSKYINNQSLSIPNRTMISQTSRKKLQTPKNEYQDHFQQIQKILMNENSNLKQQNEYLADEIRRITKKQKYLKQQLEEITFRSHQQNNYIAKLQTEFSQLKDFVEENVRALIVLLQTNSINNIKNTLSQFIEGVSDILNLDIVENVNFKEVEQRQSINSADQQIQKEIEKLSVRLQSLIKQNNSSCREPAVRRECIEIARQIKQLQNRKKTPRFSKQNSETYHLKHKRSKTKNVVKNYCIREKTSRLSLKEDSMAKKQQSEDNFKYPRQIYSKVTYRRSGSKQKRLRHADSMSSMFNRGEQR